MMSKRSFITFARIRRFSSSEPVAAGIFSRRWPWVKKSVRAVEMNQDILATVNGRFGDFTGHLDRDPRVTFVNDEARSYLARSKERFDVIQASYIDTWAATAAGAFSLTENGLYTIEAWELFLSRLTPNG